MKLLTEEIISKFENHPICSQDGKGMYAEVLVKYFNPCARGTWLITEAEREGDDWRLFGYCYIYEWEWGYLMLSELESIRLPFGLGIERDTYTTGKYVRDFLPRDERQPRSLTDFLIDKHRQLENAFERIAHDDAYVNALRIPCGRLSKETCSQLLQNVDRLCAFQQELSACELTQRIANGDTFTTNDIWKYHTDLYARCQGTPVGIGFTCGTLFMAEIIRKMLYGKYRLVLNRQPIRIDFKTPNGKIYLVYADNRIIGESKE